MDEVKEIEMHVGVFNFKKGLRIVMSGRVKDTPAMFEEAEKLLQVAREKCTGTQLLRKTNNNSPESWS